MDSSHREQTFNIALWVENDCFSVQRAKDALKILQLRHCKWNSWLCPEQLMDRDLRDMQCSNFPFVLSRNSIKPLHVQAHSKTLQWLPQNTVLRSSPRPLSFTMWWSQSYQGRRSSGVRENTKALHNGRALKIHYPLTTSHNNLCEHFLLNVMLYWWGSRGVQGQQQDSCPQLADAQCEGEGQEL